MLELEAKRTRISNMRSNKVALNITSEVGLLQQMIVHSPGEEMSLVSPENRETLLFEDILFEDRAQEEHLLMCDVFEKAVGRPGAVLQMTTLLRETFASEEARSDFIDALCRVSPERNLQAFEAELKRLSPGELLRFALTGESILQINALPLPNLIFTRDLCAVVGAHVILSNAAMAVRARESLLIRLVFRYHPAFQEHQEKIITLPASVTFEGGDLLVASPEVVLIGHSERTSFDGVTAVARALFEHTGIEHVLMVDLPKLRSFMHLDTVFTFTDYSECMVFPPIIEQNTGNVMHFTRTNTDGQFLAVVRQNLKSILEELLERPLTFIPCGGHQPLDQTREQWTDGANVFALAPGVVLGYERNRRTFEALSEHGYRIVSAQGFLSYYEESEYQPDEKVAIKLAGNELSRGRGGPRCMTLPLARQD